jgi:type II secretory pathway component PulF
MTRLTPLSNALRHLEEEADFLSDGLTVYAQELPRGPAKRHLLQVAKDIRSKRIETALGNESLPHREIMWSVIADRAAADGTHHFLEAILGGARRYSQGRQRTWRAFAHPIILLLICTLIIGFLALAIIPTLSQLYGDYDTQLPAVTQIAFKSRQLFIGLLLFMAGIALAAGLVPASTYDHLLRWVPAVNTYRRCTAVSRFCRVAAALVKADVALPAVVENAGRIPYRPLIAKSANRLAQQLRDTPDAEAQRPSYPLTSTVAYAFSPQVQCEQRPELLLGLADIYDRRALRLLRWIEIVTEPVLILVLGTITGVLFIALLAPLLFLLATLF